MKNIAIKNNIQEYGKEVLQIFKNLGASHGLLNGYNTNNNFYYYINKNNSIDCDLKRDIKNSKNYIFYESLQEYKNSLNVNINYTDI